MATCVNCGKMTGEEDRFCSGCGIKLHDPEKTRKELEKTKNDERLEKFALFIFIVGFILFVFGLWQG